METTFITIHDLSLDARILYVSTSIEDILGYTPQEVIGKSCWEYFHPDEIPFARAIHGRGVQLDKAAVLNYCQIKNKDGRWVGCECVFTIVHDVLVGCTSVYRRGLKSHKRAKEAPIIRRLFSSSPRDPRYHMLSYISQKFAKPSRNLTHEPRAALFLNRFSRTLTIMYATNGLADIVGIPANELNGKSFYYCIQENCLREAVKCLESAKANDSIAYLRFWFRDPRQDDRTDHDEHMSDGHSSGDEDDGGVHLTELMDHDGSENAVYSDSNHSMRSSVERDHGQGRSLAANSRTSSGNSTDMGSNRDEAIFDQPAGGQSRSSSVSTPDETQSSNTPWSPGPSQIELEAVVSCTSDGLVVILRRAKPIIPTISQPTLEASYRHPYANGFFASPWANESILPNAGERSQYAMPHLQQPPQGPVFPTVARANAAAMNGPPTEDFMNSIREVAVFAWSLTGINGSLEQYARGTPSGESQPPGGLPVWDPKSNAGPDIDRPISGAYQTYQKEMQHHHSFDRTHKNGFRRSTDYVEHTYSHGLHDQYLTNRNPNYAFGHDLRNNPHGNAPQPMIHDSSAGMNDSSYNSPANVYSHNAQPNESWIQQAEQDRVMDVSHQVG